MYYSSGHGKGSEAVRENMGPEGKFVNADLHDYILNIFYSKQVVLYTDIIQYLVPPPQLKTLHMEQNVSLFGILQNSATMSLLSPESLQLVFNSLDFKRRQAETNLEMGTVSLWPVTCCERCPVPGRGRQILVAGRW